MSEESKHGYRVDRPERFAYIIFLLCLIAFSVVSGMWMFEQFMRAYANEAIGLLGLFFVSGYIYLWLYKKDIYDDFFGDRYDEEFESVSNQYVSRKSWKLNTGEIPDSLYVNVEYSNGEIDWNTRTSDLDWSLNAEKPIKAYFTKMSVKPWL